MSVNLYKLTTDDVWQNMVYVKSTVSDAEGAYNFKGVEPNTSYELHAYGENHEGAANAETAESGKTEANISLVSMFNVSGAVTKDGEPVASVLAYLRGSDGSANYAYTDADGRFTFWRVKTDGSAEYTVSVSKGMDYEETYSSPFKLTADKTDANIALQPIPTYPVNFTVNTVAAGEDFALYVSNGFYYEQATANGNVYSVRLPVGTYYSYYYYYEGMCWYDTLSSVTDSGADVEITLPELITVSGKVVDRVGAGVGGANVTLIGYAYWSAVTKQDGTFRIRATKYDVGSFFLTARHETGGSGGALAILDGENNVDVGTITLQSNSVVVTVTESDGVTPIDDASVNLGSVYGYTDENGTLTLRNVPPVSAADVHVYKYGYLYKLFSATVAADGDTRLSVMLDRDPNMEYMMSLGLSNSEISSGEHNFVTLTAKVSYIGGGAPIDGELNVVLPDGLRLYSEGDSLRSDVEFTGDEYVRKLTIAADSSMDFKNLSEFCIGAYFSGGEGVGQVYKGAYENLTVVNAILDAPSIVKTDDSFNVYGTAPSGSVVAIKTVDADGLEKTVATVNVESRYFNASVSLPTAGDYLIYAVTAKDSVSNASPAIDVTALEEAAPSVANIDIAEGYVGGKPAVNPAYGAPSFSAWTQLRFAPNQYAGQYRGMMKIKGSFRIDNLGGYAVKEARLEGDAAVMGNTAAGQSSLTVSDGVYTFEFPTDSWGSVGVEPIKLILERNGKEYAFTIAIVTALIDPAGYAYDKLTGERIEGAVLTLEEKKNNVWFKWDDPDRLQPNPQTSDAEGKYGWMTPAGTFRVIATAKNYAQAIANKDDGAYDAANSEGGFPVPPEQTEVNIPMTFTGKVTVGATWVDGKLVVTFNRPLMDADAAAIAEKITLTADGASLSGTWAATNLNRTFTFTPTGILANGTVIKTVVDPTVTSRDGDGFSLGRVAIPDVTVTAKTEDPGDPTQPGEPEQPDTSSQPGGSVIGGGALAIEPQKPAKPGESMEETDSAAADGEAGEDGEPADAAALDYGDIGVGDWFFEGVAYVTEKGLMIGVGGNLFAPEQDMTRAALVTVLYRHAGTLNISAAGRGHVFTDVPVGEWYADAVAWAFENGIVMGYSGEIFAPDNSVTREQIVVVLNRFAKLQGIDVSDTADISGFDDASAVSDWATDAMAWAYAAGLIRGRTDTEIAPSGVATRAEVATLLMRFIENL